MLQFLSCIKYDINNDIDTFEFYSRITIVNLMIVKDCFLAIKNSSFFIS